MTRLGRLELQRDTNALKIGGQRREELHEMRKYAISYMLVYGAENCNINPACWPGNRDMYIGGETWIELRFRIKSGRYAGNYIACIRAAASEDFDALGQVVTVDVNDYARRLQDSMFVSDVKLIENSQEIMLRPIPSLIRLELVDNFPNSGPYIFGDPTQSSSDGGVVPILQNRETGAPFSTFQIPRCQLRWKDGQGKDDLVEGGAQLIHELPNTQTNFNRRRHYRLEPTFVERLIRIELCDHAMWMKHLLVDVQIPLDYFQMFIRPPKFADNSLKGMEISPESEVHGIYLPYERGKETNNTENPQRLRDTDSYQGRGIKVLRKAAKPTKKTSETPSRPEKD